MSHQFELNLDIKIVKIINTSHLDERMDRIYSSIFGRTASLATQPNVIFEEWNTKSHMDKIEQYDFVTGYPFTIFFKNNKVVYYFQGLKATAQLLELLEKVKYL